jgi:hypothetical protein
MSIGVVLLQPESLISGKSLSWITSRGSMLQALSHVSDGTTETMLVVARCRSRVNMAVAQCHYRPMLVTTLPSPAGCDLGESTLPWRDIDVESCW